MIRILLWSTCFTLVIIALFLFSMYGIEVLEKDFKDYLALSPTECLYLSPKIKTTSESLQLNIPAACCFPSVKPISL